MNIVQMILLIALLFFSGPKNAATEIDCTRDQRAYARCVAEMTAEASFVTEPDSDGTFIVLCKTDGADVDFLSTNPVQIAAGPKNAYTISYRTAQAAIDAADALSGTAGVIYAECDSALFACEEEVFNSYGAAYMGFGPYLDFANAHASGSAMIAVIDSGVYRHSAIVDRLVSGGHDYVDNDDDPWNDGKGHGTHVAGIMADCTRNATVKLYPIRVLDNSGAGSVANAVNAIAEAVDRGVDVINFSISASVISSALDDAVTGAAEQGVTVVAAAGNEGKDVSGMSPGHIASPGVIIVGNARGSAPRSAIRASSSNYGASVDVYAYGENILSCSNTNGYVYKSGTSMAAPHVAALCALLECVCGDLSPSETEARVKRATIPVNGLDLLDLYDIYPQSFGFRLTDIALDSADRIAMPTQARPLKSGEAIRYTSSDPTVADVTDGILSVTGTGSAIITADCFGLDDVSFTVEALDGGCVSVRLPASLKTLDSEAFSGDGSIAHAILPAGLLRISDSAFADCGSLRTVTVPESVTEIGEGAFGGAVILCPGDSFAAEYAAAHQLQYIAAE